MSMIFIGVDHPGIFYQVKVDVVLPVHGIKSRSGHNHWSEYKSPAPLLGAPACVESTSKQLILCGNIDIFWSFRKTPESLISSIWYRYLAHRFYGDTVNCCLYALGSYIFIRGL